MTIREMIDEAMQVERRRPQRLHQWIEALHRDPELGRRMAEASVNGTHLCKSQVFNKPQRKGCWQ